MGIFNAICSGRILKIIFVNVLKNCTTKIGLNLFGWEKLENSVAIHFEEKKIAIFAHTLSIYVDIIYVYYFVVIRL